MLLIVSVSHVAMETLCLHFNNVKFKSLTVKLHIVSKIKNNASINLDCSRRQIGLEIGENLFEKQKTAQYRY